MAGDTMAMKVFAALRDGAKNLADVVEKTGLPRPKAYAALHQLKLEGKAVRSGPRGWERGKWSLASPTDAAQIVDEEESAPTSGTRLRTDVIG